MTCSVPRALVLSLTSLISLLLLAGAAGATQEGLVLRPADGPGEEPASVTGSGMVAKFTDQLADTFMVPFFRVDRSDLNGETTLIAVRNASEQTHDVNIFYWLDHPFDPFGDPDLVQSFSLIPDEVATFNLRDLPEITGGEGGDALVRGWLMVEHADGVGDPFSADWFRVNPGQDFATGGRMVDVDHTSLCTQWDLRYLVGGAFAGGTRFEFFVDTPLGDNPGGDDSTMTIDFFSEPGAFLGGVEVFTNRQVAELDVADLLAQLPGSPASFGSMVVTFQPGTNGGLVTGTYRAEGRYSVGLNGTCVVP